MSTEERFREIEWRTSVLLLLIVLMGVAGKYCRHRIEALEAAQDASDE